jgi:hypothetical protein
MQVLILWHFYKTSDYVFHKLKHFSFTNLLLFLQKTTQITFIAVLGDYVAVGGVTYDIKASENVGVFEFSEGLDLAI